MSICPECKKEMDLSEDAKAWFCVNEGCGYFFNKRKLYYKHTENGYRWYTEEFLRVAASSADSVDEYITVPGPKGRKVKGW